MNVLIDFEESQAITIEMRKRGHNAFSCDLKYPSGGHPEWHLQMDGFDALFHMKWDLIVMHPPCTHLCISGNRWYAGTEQRRHAANWTYELWKQAKTVCDRVAMENPVGVLNSFFPLLPQPQYIHPYHFGHPETKKTGLWLYGLPELKPTDIVEPAYIVGRDGKKYSRIHYLTQWAANGERGKIRSKTYKGIAEAMALQWA